MIETEDVAGELKNQNIGELGRAFIAQHTEVDIPFDEAWAHWQRISAMLHFVIVDCPEVRYYDDRRVCDLDERLRIRTLAQELIGSDIRSPDVSALRMVAAGLDIAKPMRPYHMDRECFEQVMQDLVHSIEMEEGYTEKVAQFKAYAADDELIDSFVEDIEQFASENALWAVPPERITKMFCRYLGEQQEENTEGQA